MGFGKAGRLFDETSARQCICVRFFKTQNPTWEKLLCVLARLSEARLTSGAGAGAALARSAHGMWRCRSAGPLTPSLFAGGAALPRHETGGQQEGGAARRGHLCVRVQTAAGTSA